MLQQLSSQIDDPIKREEFWFRLQLRRINVDAVANDLRKAFWLRFAPTAVAYVAVGLVAFAAALSTEIWSLLGLAGAAGGGGILHKSVFDRNAMKSWSLETQFEKYVSEPDYRSHLGMLHWVDHDLDRALDLLCGDYPVAVFIDDLDRCDPKIVAEIIFAINQFLSLPRRNVFFFIGMDTEMVAEALEQARDMPDTAGANQSETHQSFGWRFMEKFIQLPFVIPHLNDKTAMSFAANRLGGSLPDEDGTALSTEERANESQSAPKEAAEVIHEADNVTDFEELAELAKGEVRQSRSPEQRVKVQRAISKKATELLSDPESEEIGRIVQIAIEDLELNPRSITRYFGAVRILRNLQVSASTLSEPDRDRVIVLRAAHLLLNWPEAVQWLQRTKEFLAPGDEWVSTVPGLESLIADSGDWAEWSKLWLGDRPTALPPVFRDHRLFAFLQKTVENPPGLREIHQARFF